MLQPKQKAIFVCDVCGNEERFFNKNHPCNTSKQPDVTDLKVGDEVQLYAPDWQERDKPLCLHSFGIWYIHYSKPRETLYPDWLSMFLRELPPHTLVIGLAQSDYRDAETGRRKRRAWKRGDTSFSTIEITHQDFLLWKEGDRVKLEAAGMLLPLKKSWIKKLFGWLNLG